MPRLSKTNRREFLQTGAALGAAALVPGTAGRALGAEAASDRPVVATIGLRNQGWVITEPALDVAEVAALVDVDSKVLADVAGKVTEATEGKKPDTYQDYRDVLAREDIDAVLVATPDHWHTKISVEAMYAGKDVYCEKPLTLTIDEGKLIERVVKETGRVFQVGTMQRSDGRFLEAIALAHAGRLGEIRRVKCSLNPFPSSPPIPTAPVPETLDWDRWLGPAPEVPYRALPEMREGYGGGVPRYSNGHYSFRMWHDFSGGRITDWGAHHVDIACWALGLETGPSKITPTSYKLPVEHERGYPVVDNRYNAATDFEIAVEMPGGVEMIITSEGDNGILLEGTEGRIFVNRGKLVGKPVEDLAENPLPEDAIEAVYGGPIPRSHVANFVESMRSRKQPISDVWSHNRMLEICHLSNIAMRLGRALDWDPVKREVINDREANAFLSRESRPGWEIQV